MKIAFHTLGCKVNQYETEAMKEAFVSRGATIASEDESADVYIVNTCTVTNIADRKSRQYIRRMKGVNPEAYVVVTGCYAQVESKEVSDLPEVDLVVGNSNKSKICDLVYGLMDGSLTTDAEDKSIVKACGEFATESHLVLPRNELTEFEDMGLVVSSESGMTRAYIKIQEGCDRFCAYCLIPFARGPVRSRPLDDILQEAHMLLDAGYKELVLTGINTALYGTESDFEMKFRDEEGNIYPGCEELAERAGINTAEPGATINNIAPIELMLARLDAIDKDFRIRLSSLEPTVVDKNDVERIIRYNKLCHHLHLSAQSGSSHVLSLMNRHYNKDDYLDIVRAIHDYDPYYNITTDIIVGFSGETDADFQDSIDVTRKSEFGKVHIFRYSKRKGTVGEKLPDEVSGTLKAERARALADVADEVAKAFIEKNREITHRVLIEESIKIGRKQYLTGYTGNYIRVYAESSCDMEHLIGHFVDVKLCEQFKDGCLAEVVQ